MPRFRFYHAFVMSFYSQPFYRDVALQWRGIGLLVLTSLLLVCWGVQGLKMQLGLHAFMKESDLGIMEQIPDIDFRNGIVHTDVEQPYEIWVEENGESLLLAVIDTTGTINSLDDTDNAMLLLTRDKIHTRNERQTRIHDLQGFNYHLTRERLEGWTDLFATWAVPLLIVCAFVGSLVYRLVVALIYSLLALVIRNNKRIEIPYVGCLRIAVMALVPVIIVDTLHSLIGSPLPGLLWWILCVGGACTLIIRGVLACDDSNVPLPTTDPELNQPQDFGQSI